MRVALAAYLSFLVFAPAGAQSIVESETADQTWLTIYPDNLAMITERRVINIPQGKSKIRFLGVSDQIVPQTSVLQSFEGITIESNFDGDLISRGALLDRAVGQNLKVRVINPETGKTILKSGKLISAAHQNDVVQGIIMETSEGVEALECSGLPESLLFNNLPDGLNAKPVLSMNVDAPMSGEKEVLLSYLSRGIGWEADYRLDVGNNEKGEGPLTGWLTITNNTVKSFKNSPTAIIAGKLNVTGNTKPDIKRQKSFIPGCWTKGTSKKGTQAKPSLYRFIGVPGAAKYRGWDGQLYDSPAMAPQQTVSFSAGIEDEIIVTATKRQATLEDFQDYKLYRTPQPVTVAALQTKQISFVNLDNAEYDRVYKFNFYPWQQSIPHNAPRSMSVEYQIDNSKDGNLAKPLPKGNFRVMTRRESGKTAFLGEAAVRDLAVDLPVEVPISKSVGVTISTEKFVRGSDDGMVAILNAIVMNATNVTINSEIKIDTDDLRYNHLSSDNQNRKTDSAVPTYQMAIAPESFERLSVEVPVTERAVYRHAYINYLDDPELEKYEREASVRDYYLKGEEDNLNWGRELAAGSNIPPLKINSEILSRAKEMGNHNIEVTTFDEEITITNTYNANRTIKIVIDRLQQFELLDSSQKPDKGSKSQWTLKVPANGKKVLKIKTKGNHGI